MRLCRSATERDCYIGPVRDAPYCNCAESPIDECHACRLTWSWYDRSETMNWWNWQNRNEPNEFQCARVTSDGVKQWERRVETDLNFGGVGLVDTSPTAILARLVRA